MQRKLNWHGDFLTNGKNLSQGKTPPCEFKGTTPKNPLINNQTVTSMKNLITMLAYPKIPTVGLHFIAQAQIIWSLGPMSPI